MIDIEGQQNPRSCDSDRDESNVSVSIWDIHSVSLVRKTRVFLSSMLFLLDSILGQLSLGFCIWAWKSVCRTVISTLNSGHSYTESINGTARFSSRKKSRWRRRKGLIQGIYTYALYIDTIRRNESARAYEPSCSRNSAAPYDQVMSLIDVSIYKNL